MLDLLGKHPPPMHCPIHISFRNFAPSDEVENACWREAAAIANVAGVANCRLCVEGSPPSAAGRDGSRDMSGSVRITLDFRVGGDVVHESEVTGASAVIEPISNAVRAVIARGLAAARARGNGRAA